MLVSVVMPVFNGESFLKEALASVVQQTHRHLELLVVDDGSSDSSAALVGRYARSDPRLRYLRQPNGGVTSARNRGMAEARGELVTFLDQDDRWTRNALQLQVACHRAMPDIGYSVAHQICFLDSPGEVPDWFRLQRLHEPTVAYLPGTLAVKRAALATVGSFDRRYVISSDADWFARAKDLGLDAQVLPEVILERRIHRSNQSRFVPQIHSELIGLLHASIRRKRAGR